MLLHDVTLKCHIIIAYMESCHYGILRFNHSHIFVAFCEIRNLKQLCIIFTANSLKNQLLANYRNEKTYQLTPGGQFCSILQTPTYPDLHNLI